MSQDILSLNLTQALNALEKGELSSVELTKAYIQQVDRGDHLNAYITKTPDVALEQAVRSDSRRKKGEALPLDGIPIANKDLFCTKGIKTTAGSKILHNFVPTYESTVTDKLLKAGVTTLGKLNLDEFAMGSANTTSYYGPAVNPWRSENAPDQNLVPGGSSGGSAASVAGRLALGSTGTDTGGSIRQPASFCGIVGVKPTYGRCSRWGIAAFASSLDQAGVFGRCVEDCAHLLKVISGYDPKDSTSAPKETPDFPNLMPGNVKGLKVGIPKEYRVDDMPQEIEDLWQKGIEWLQSGGAEIIDISLPHTHYALPAYYIIATAEASSNLARYDGVRYGLRVEGEDLKQSYMKTRAEGFGDEVQRRIMIGTYVLSSGYYDAYYRKAQKVRRLILQDFEKAYEKCDVLLTPTTPGSAFPIGDKEDDPVKMYLNDIFTVAVNLAGLPGISIPAGLDSNQLPLGLQLIGKKWDEELLFNVGKVIENAAQFKHIPQFIHKNAA